MVQTSRDYLFSIQVEITFHPNTVAETAISKATRLKIIIRMSGELPVLQENLLAALSREVMKTRYRHPVPTCPDYQFLVGTHETSWGFNLVTEANAYIRGLIMPANGTTSTSTTHDTPQVSRGGRGGRGGRGVFRGETHQTHPSTTPLVASNARGRGGRGGTQERGPSNATITFRRGSEYE